MACRACVFDGRLTIALGNMGLVLSASGGRSSGALARLTESSGWGPEGGPSDSDGWRAGSSSCIIADSSAASLAFRRSSASEMGTGRGMTSGVSQLSRRRGGKRKAQGEDYTSSAPKEGTIWAILTIIGFSS